MSTTAVIAPRVIAPQSPARLALRRFLRRPIAVAGLVVIVAFILIAAFAPLITPYDPIATSWTAIRKAPSALHWMGTDENGRDVAARVIFGARASLLAGVVSVLIAAGIGVPAGLLAGFAGGIADMLLSRIVDAMLACPFLILAIALAAFLGPDLTNAMIAIGVSTAPRFMRVARAATLEAAANEYVEAARARQSRLAHRGAPCAAEHRSAGAGAGHAGDRRRDHCRGVAVVPRAGPAAADPSWGSMLNSAQRFLSQAPWLAVFPGLAIFLCVLSFNLVGDGLRDALDPRGR